MNWLRNICPLSEKAITIKLGNVIDEKIHYQVVSLQQFIQELQIPGFVETVPAYCDLTFFYNPLELISAIPEAKQGITKWLMAYLSKALEHWQPANTMAGSAYVEIPVCYDSDFGFDLDEVAAFHHCSREEIIEAHYRHTYKVYMMGFTPGFPYLGILPDTLATPRKNQPRLTVPEGSVALAGNQTGIYPLQSPGGWNIIGRTPLKLFDKKKENPFLLATGDTVKFIPISKEIFNELSCHD